MLEGPSTQGVDTEYDINGSEALLFDLDMLRVKHVAQLSMFFDEKTDILDTLLNDDVAGELVFELIRFAYDKMSTAWNCAQKEEQTKEVSLVSINKILAPKLNGLDWQSFIQFSTDIEKHVRYWNDVLFDLGYVEKEIINTQQSTTSLMKKLKGCTFDLDVRRNKAILQIRRSSRVNATRLHQLHTELEQAKKIEDAPTKKAAMTQIVNIIKCIHALDSLIKECWKSIEEVGFEPIEPTTSPIGNINLQVPRMLSSAKVDQLLSQLQTSFKSLEGKTKHVADKMFEELTKVNNSCKSYADEINQFGSRVILAEREKMQSLDEKKRLKRNYEENINQIQASLMKMQNLQQNFQQNELETDESWRVHQEEMNNFF